MLLKPSSETSFYYHIKQPFFLVLLRFPPPMSLISETQKLFLSGAFILYKKQPFSFDPAFFLL
jgi:hypothetical protein